MKSKKLFLALVAGFLGLGVTACGGDKKPDPVKDEITGISLNETGHTFALKGEVFTLEATLTFTGNPDKTITWSTDDDKIVKLSPNGDKCAVEAVADEGTCVVTAKAGEKSAKCNISFIPKAGGVYDYSNDGYAAKTAMTGALEKWAVDNKITGITVYEDGGYVMYSPDLEKGAPAYIKGFGFGSLMEGRLTADLAGEEEAKYKRYYHTYESSDPGSILYMDDDGGVVSGYVGYASSGYFETVMNETRTGYNWVGDLATVDRPIAIDPDASGASKVYAIPVKTGANLKYSTLTKDQALAQYNNREVTLDDYITPYKVYYTSAYGMRRNAEISDSNAGSIKGGDAYVKASAEGFNATAWENVGIKGKNNATYGDYIEFTFNKAYTPFWAMYYLSSSMYAPVPESFITALGGGVFADGVKLWGKFNNDTTKSPVDTFLSTGPYTLETWEFEKLITFKRNPNYVKGEVETKRPCSYNMEGIYLDCIKALNTDREAAFKKFLDNKLHAVTIPSTKIAEYATDPRTTIVPGSSTTKLNLNTCNPEQWEDLFGEDGSITTTPKANYWKVKPCMSNTAFIDGLSYAIDRVTFAASLGATPSNDYFGSGYYANPEEGIFYNDTAEHKLAVAESLEGTDGYGYSLEKAKVAFKLACDELIAEGAYDAGDEIELEMAWMVASQEDTYAKPLAKMIQDAFNNCGGGLTLKINHYYGAVYTDVYYKKMMIGQFDIGYGGVEGNAYNPLNFLEVLKSDNSSTFTLNWGIPTNEYVEIEYDNKLWTFDALWEVGDHGGYVEEGKNCPVYYGGALDNPKLDADNNLVQHFGYINTCVLKQGVTEPTSYTDYDLYCDFAGLCLYSKNEAYGYNELYFIDGIATPLFNGSQALKGEQYWFTFDYTEQEDYTLVTFTMSAATLAFWEGLFPQDTATLKSQGWDMYIAKAFFGEEPEIQFYGTVWSNLLPVPTVE